jgi:hypothetical protein
MQLIAGGAGKGGAPGMPAGGAEQAPPGVAGASPMSTPQPAQGEIANAMVTVHLAMSLLTQVLPALGAQSEEGRTVLSVLSTLSKKFGEQQSKSSELVPAELRQLMENLPQAGGMSPTQKAMGQQPIQMPGGAGGMPGGAPGGMPGGMPGMPH